MIPDYFVFYSTLYKIIISLKLTKVNYRPIRVIIIHKSKQKEFIIHDIQQILLLTWCPKNVMRHRHNFFPLSGQLYVLIIFSLLTHFPQWSICTFRHWPISNVSACLTHKSEISICNHFWSNIVLQIVWRNDKMYFRTWIWFVVLFLAVQLELTKLEYFSNMWSRCKFVFIAK